MVLNDISIFYIKYTYVYIMYNDIYNIILCTQMNKILRKVYNVHLRSKALNKQCLQDCKLL